MGILDPDFPAVSEAQRVWQENYLAMVNAQDRGVTPQFSGDDYVSTIDRVTGIPFLPQVNQFGGGGGITSIQAGTNITVDDTNPQSPIINASGGGGGGSLTPIIATDSWEFIDESDRVIVTSELANTYILLLTTKLITFQFSYLTWDLGDSMKITLNASLGAAQASVVGDGGGTASLLGPSGITTAGSTIEVTCFSVGVLDLTPATYLCASYGPSS